MVVGEFEGEKGVSPLVGSKNPVSERPKRASEPPKTRDFVIGVLRIGGGKNPSTFEQDSGGFSSY